MKTNHPQHRTGSPAEIGLKQFYSMEKEEREQHINELKKLQFVELSQVDLSVIHFWYQDWKLTEFPQPNKKFISMDENLF